MSLVNPTTEDIERLQKQLSKALGNEYQVEMDTAVSSPYFNIKNVFDLVIFRNDIPFVGIEYKSVLSSIQIELRPTFFYRRFQESNLKYGICTSGKENHFYLWKRGEFGFQESDFASIINAIKQDLPLGERLNINDFAVEILGLLPDSIVDVELYKNLDKLFTEENIIFDDTKGYISFEQKVEDAFFKTLLPQMNVSKVCRYTSLNNLFLLLKEKHHCLCSLTCMNDIGETSYADNWIGDGAYAETYKIVDENNNSYILSCCDSDKIDDLTMWRLYGQNAMGTCLVYNVNEELIDNNSFFFAPVSYGQSETEHWQLDFIGNILSWSKNGWRFKFNRWYIWKHFFKSYLFKDEQEIRLLYIRSKDSNIERRWIMDSTNSIASSLCLFDIENSKFPLSLSSAIIGPKCSQQASNIAQFNYMNFQQKVFRCDRWNEAITASRINDYR